MLDEVHNDCPESLLLAAKTAIWQITASKQIQRLDDAKRQVILLRDSKPLAILRRLFAQISLSQHHVALATILFFSTDCHNNTLYWLFPQSTSSGTSSGTSSSVLALGRLSLC